MKPRVTKSSDLMEIQPRLILPKEESWYIEQRVYNRKESNFSMSDASPFLMPKDTMKVTDIKEWQERRKRIWNPYRKLDTALGLIEEEKSEVSQISKPKISRQKVEIELPEVVSP